MTKIYLFIIFFFIANCTINNVVKHHGVHYLDKKHENLVLSITNKNDIISLLGPPSTKSTFDNDVWIYIEKKTTNKSIFKLGKEKLIVNNVLVLEVDTKGLLVKKEFFDINKMTDLEFSKKSTDNDYLKKSFVYDVLSSMRQKINDPLNKRRK
jgi:outer membrane protein assembly factor BamE (lipoprotein component of BamABCDE complex)